MQSIHQEPINTKRVRITRALHGSITFDENYCADTAKVMRSVLQVRAYPDTIELYIGGKRPDKKEEPRWHAIDCEIKEIQSARKKDNPAYKTPWFEKVVFRNMTIGSIYVVQRPFLETFKLLDTMMTWPFVTLRRGDISYDFATAAARHTLALQQHLTRHVVLRWCRSPRMPDIGGQTTYWAEYKHLPRRLRPIRNLTGYPVGESFDKPSKLGDRFAWHQEVRTLTTASVKRMLQSDHPMPSDILKINPKEHFERNCFLVDFDVEELQSNWPRLRHVTQDYRAQLILKHLHHWKPERVDIGLLKLPSKLTIDAEK